MAANEFDDGEDIQKDRLKVSIISAYFQP